MMVIKPDQRIPMSKLEDSGHRVQVNTGAVRERAPGKGRFDAISPVMLRRLALLLEAADIKYGDCRNWEKGLPLSWYIDAAYRHINDFRLGERTEDHIIQALWNLMCYVHTDEMIDAGLLPNELNDLPIYYLKGKQNAKRNHNARSKHRKAKRIPSHNANRR